MSYFYSSCQGGRGEATRCGHKSTGVRASVQSFEGSIGTTLHVGSDGVIYATIRVEGRSTSDPRHCLYHGPLEDLLSEGGRIALLKRAATEPLRSAA